MTEAEAQLTCANCGRHLDSADKFCRECGLPTPRRAEQIREQAPVPPPDTQELQRALDVKPEPRPFVREEPEEEKPDEQDADTTGSVVQATSPTFAASMATSTLVMIGLILILAIGGAVLLFFAFR